MEKKYSKPDANPKFSAWFKAQFGQPPTKRSSVQICTMLNAARDLVVALEFELQRLDRYQDSERAAHYAWTAARDPHPEAWQRLKKSRLKPVADSEVAKPPAFATGGVPFSTFRRAAPSKRSKSKSRAKKVTVRRGR